MGLSGGSELLVILMFLIVAEVLNSSGMSTRLITFAASIVGHLRGGMAYVCQVTSMVVSGISGSAQADAASMTPLLVPAMEREGYRRDVAAAVVAGASIKGPIGPLSIMFIVYGVVVQGPASASISRLLLSGVIAATAYLQVTALGRVGEPEYRIVFYFSVGSTVVGAASLLWTGLHAHTLRGAALLLAVGVLATLAQLMITRAYGRGRALVNASLQYLGIAWSFAYGVILFGDHVTAMALSGMLLIVGAGLSATLLRSTSGRADIATVADPPNTV
jgi:TRAP-type C4-dicarboxylate transport system permease large subunit